MVVFPVVKHPSMVVSLYNNVMLLVVDNPMYENPLAFNYILANDSPVLKAIIYVFAVNCVSVKAFKLSSLITFISPHLNTLASKLNDNTLLPGVLTFWFNVLSASDLLYEVDITPSTSVFVYRVFNISTMFVPLLLIKPNVSGISGIFIMLSTSLFV